MKLYCVYLTIYRGNKMPPFYIGSSSVDKILNKKYHGSVSSKQWKETWWSEIKDNPHLFESKIICTHETRQEAIDKEYKLQVALNILKKSEMYINRAVATVNGFFGLSKENHPLWGIGHSEKTKRKQSLSRIGRKESEETKKKKSIALTGIVRSQESKNKMSIAKKDKSLSTNHRQNISNSILGEKNPRYGHKYTEEEREIRRKAMKQGYISGKIKSQKGIVKHTEEFKNDMSKKMSGENSPIYGKICINNGLLNKYINFDESIPVGWNRGGRKVPGRGSKTGRRSYASIFTEHDLGIK